jgi:hypothetical protein
MKRKLICMLFAVALVMPTIAAAGSEQDFIADSTDDIIALCSAAPTDPNYIASIHFCQGYLLGAYAYYNALATGPGGVKLVCFPDPPPSRNQGIAMFVEWAKAHPQYMQEEPVETFFRFLTEKWPCPKLEPQAAKPSKKK